MRKRIVQFAIILGLGVAAFAAQDSLEFFSFKAWIALTQAPSASANPAGRAVANVVLQQYYDRLQAVAYYRTLEACVDQECLSDVLYDLNPHINLYLPEDSEALACSLKNGDWRQTKGNGSNVVYLHLHTFELDSDCIEQIWQVLRRAANPNDLVLDLRGNGGGYFEDALALGSFLIPKGVRLTTPLERYPKSYLWAHFNLPLEFINSGVRNRMGQSYPFSDRETRKVSPRRIYILIDQDSASASEILANLLAKYAISPVEISGNEYSRGVGNTLMNTFQAGPYSLDLPTAVLPGFGLFAQPKLNLEQAAKQLGLTGFP